MQHFVLLLALVCTARLLKKNVIMSQFELVTWGRTSPLFDVSSAVQGPSWRTWSVCWEETPPPAPAPLRPITTHCPSPRRPAWKVGACPRAPAQVQSLKLLSLKLVVKFILVWSARSFLIFLPSILDHYGSIWSGGVSSSYGYNTNPNNLSTTSTLYQSGQQSVARRNNEHDDVQLLHLTFLN